MALEARVEGVSWVVMGRMRPPWEEHGGGHRVAMTSPSVGSRGWEPGRREDAGEEERFA